MIHRLFFVLQVIVFATGYQSIRKSIHKLISEAVATRLGPVWGKDNQGEIPGTWRLCGQPGLWLMCGNLWVALVLMFLKDLYKNIGPSMMMNLFIRANNLLLLSGSHMLDAL
jgi:hypothetical protein